MFEGAKALLDLALRADARTSERVGALRAVSDPRCERVAAREARIEGQPPGGGLAPKESRMFIHHGDRHVPSVDAAVAVIKAWADDQWRHGSMEVSCTLAVGSSPDLPLVLVTLVTPEEPTDSIYALQAMARGAAREVDSPAAIWVLPQINVLTREDTSVGIVVEYATFRWRRFTGLPISGRRHRLTFTEHPEQRVSPENMEMTCLPTNIAKWKRVHPKDAAERWPTKSR
jgi:hypothetical protein